MSLRNIHTLRNTLLIILLATICVTAIAHAYAKIFIAPLKRTYIVQPGTFKMGIAVRYVTNSSKPLNTTLVVYICDFFTSQCKSFKKNIVLYPNKTSLFFIDVEVPRPSYYIAIGNVKNIFTTLSKIVCVRDIKRDVVTYGPFLIAAVNEPENYTFSTFVSYVKYVVNWYLSHGIRIAYPCLGPPFVIMTYNLNVLGSGVLGVTVPQFYIFKNGTSLGCVWLVAVNMSMPSPTYEFLKDVIAHELFHSAQTYYMRNSTFLQYWKENWWTIEGGAVAAPYFVWKRSLFPSLLGWSRVWFHYRWYRYDPAWAWYVLYERCMRRCMIRQGTWWSCEDYCESLSYLSYYIYAPLMWYIFNKEGLTPTTMRTIYDSPSPATSPEILNLLYQAYVDYLRGFPPKPQLKVRPIYMNSTRFTAYVWYRAPLYVRINIANKGHYRLFISTNAVRTYLYQAESGSISIIKGNNSLITVENGTTLLIVPRLEKMPLQYEIQQHIIPVTITLVRSLEDCKVMILTPPSLVIGREQKLIVYLENCTSLTSGIVKIVIREPSLAKIVGIEIPRMIKSNVKLDLLNSSTVILSLKFNGVPYREIPLLIIRVYSYHRGIENVLMSTILYSNKTGETLKRYIARKIAVSSYLYCDFNHNGKIDIGDIVLALRYVMRRVKPPVNCDLNGNGVLDIGDVVLLVRYMTMLSALLAAS